MRDFFLTVCAGEAELPRIFGGFILTTWSLKKKSDRACPVTTKPNIGGLILSSSLRILVLCCTSVGDIHLENSSRSLNLFPALLRLFTFTLRVSGPVTCTSGQTRT